MWKPITGLLTAGAVVSGLIIGLYDAKDNMPSFLFAFLLTFLIACLVIIFVVLCHKLWIWTSPLRKRYGLRNPIYTRDRPNPLQWLIDIAGKQKDNPVTYLVVRDRIYFDFKRDVVRPYLWVRVFYNNLGVHDLLIGSPEGFANYGDEKLPDKIELEEGQSSVPANGGNGELDFRIYINSDFVAKISQETDSGTREIRNLKLHDISAKVWINGDKTRFVKWSLGGDRVIFRPNR